MDNALGFNLSQLDVQTRAIVEKNDRAFERHIQGATENFLLACHDLKRIRDVLRYTHPGFVAYCRAKPGVSPRTIYKMLRVAKMFAQDAHIDDMGKDLLYRLAELSDAPDQVIEDIVQDDRPLTLSQVKGMITTAMRSAERVTSEIRETGGYVSGRDGKQKEATKPGAVAEAIEEDFKETLARQTGHIFSNRTVDPVTGEIVPVKTNPNKAILDTLIDFGQLDTLLAVLLKKGLQNGATLRIVVYRVKGEKNEG